MTFIQTGGQPEFFAALKSGAVQSAVLNTGPFTVRAQKENFLRLADVAAMGRPYVYGTVAARESFIKTRPDVIVRFAKAFVEGIHRFKTDKSLALATIEKYTKSKTTAESEQVYEIYAQRYTKRAPPPKACKPFSMRSATAGRFPPGPRRSALSTLELSRIPTAAASSTRSIAATEIRDAKRPQR